MSGGRITRNLVKSEYLISFSTIGEEIQFDQVFGLFGRFGQLSKLRFGNDYLPTYFNFASTRHLARKARSAVYVTYAGSLHSCKCLYNNSDFIFKKLLGVSYWAMISGTLATAWTAHLLLCRLPAWAAQWYGIAKIRQKLN